MRRVWILGLLLAACGARTELSVEPCDADASVARPCTNACGEGMQRCVDGAWSGCEAPIAERACEAVCGPGEQRCVEGAWEECVGPERAERACEGVCGAGVEVCADDTWAPCVGPPTGERACENACGSGMQRCADDLWGACEVAPVARGCEDACGAGTQSCVAGEWSECDVAPAERPCTTECGEGIQTCVAGRWGRCSASDPRPPTLRVIVRDFTAAHPDMEAGAFGFDPGIVEPLLGADDRPVYAGLTMTTHGRDAFDQWYRDVPGINERTEIDLSLRPSPSDPSLFVFEDLTFFPIDGALFGNEGRAHNFHFTLEAETEFVYLGGETFRFAGDDDVFVFIDGRLVIDLGGVHGALEATVELDTLGLVPGERYPLRLFFAERHTEESTFTIETTLSDVIVCD